MDDIFVARLMSTDLVTVDPDALVEEAAEMMLSEAVGSVLVVAPDGGLEGILTTTDFVRIVAERKPKDQTPVSAYMTGDPITVGAQDRIRDAADVMIDHGFHHLPVVDEDAGLIGMITTTDLAAYLSRARTPSPS